MPWLEYSNPNEDKEEVCVQNVDANLSKGDVQKDVAKADTRKGIPCGYCEMCVECTCDK